MALDLRALSSSFLGFLYPLTCPVCRLSPTPHRGRETLRNIASHFLCESCNEFPDFYSPDPHRCASCCELLPRSVDGPLCLLCKGMPIESEILWSAFAYDGVLEHLIRLYKYGPVRHLGALLAELFAFAAANDPLALGELHDPIICIVPSSRSSMCNRGFQHLSVFAGRLGKQIGAEVELGALRSARDREAQAGLSLRARIRNMKGAFLVRSKSIRGREIILVDDVVTTGTTAQQAAAALYAAGALQVRVLTLARSRRFVHHRMEQLLHRIQRDQFHPSQRA